MRPTVDRPSRRTRHSCLLMPGSGNPARHGDLRLPGRRAGMAFAAGHRDSFHQMVRCGAAAARAHGGDPQAGGPAQIVGRSDVRAGYLPLRPGVELPGGGPATVVMAIMGAWETAMPGAGRTRSSARIVVVCAS